MKNNLALFYAIFFHGKFMYKAEILVYINDYASIKKGMITELHWN